MVLSVTLTRSLYTHTRCCCNYVHLHFLCPRDCHTKQYTYSNHTTWVSSTWRCAFSNTPHKLLPAPAIAVGSEFRLPRATFEQHQYENLRVVTDDLFSNTGSPLVVTRKLHQLHKSDTTHDASIMKVRYNIQRSAEHANFRLPVLPQHADRPIQHGAASRLPAQYKHTSRSRRKAFYQSEKTTGRTLKVNYHSTK